MNQIPVLDVGLDTVIVVDEPERISIIERFNSHVIFHTFSGNAYEFSIKDTVPGG